jgi:hypothetical protein
MGAAGCSQAMTSGADGPDRDLPTASVGTDGVDGDADRDGDGEATTGGAGVTTTSEATASGDDPASPSAPPSTPTPSPPTTAAPTTTAPPTTTTEPELDVFDAGCVVEVLPGDSLGAIVTARADELVTVASLQAENGLADEVVDAGQLLDVCIDNGLDDITGEQRLERNAAVVAAETFTAVANQQTRLNELLAPFGYPAMPVDGDSGPVTRRALCAARVALGMGVNRQDMEPGSLEEYVFFNTFTLANPQNVTTDGRWAFIDVTCQVMFIGEGPNLVYVFPTSTGEPEHKTRLQERVRAFRYNPAAANGGWHNSSVYPVADDNPLNGNMYKPIYFDRGQAIHGANSVPTSPQSKGCARLRPEHQDMLVNWLGLGGTSSMVGGGSINLTVTVRGDYAAG